MPETHQLSLPAIMCETGLDESFLVGSKEELTALAQAILQAVEQPENKQVLFKQQVGEVSGCFSEQFGDVCIDGILITKNSIETKKLINTIRVHNGEQPVAAKGWLKGD